MATTTLPQPDFGAAAMDLRRVADQFELCPNIPAFDAAAQLVRSMEAMGEKMESLETLVRNGFQEMGRRMNTLDHRLRLMSKNNVALIYNGSVRHQGVRLAPLYSIDTGQLIQGCPEDIAQADSMRAGEVNRLLTELGETTEGSLEARKARLKMSLGLQVSVWRGAR